MNKHNTETQSVETVVEKPQIVEMEEISNDPLVTSSQREISSDDLDDLEDFAPQMNVSVPEQTATDATHLISDSQYLSVLEEVLGNIRDDRKQVSDYVDNLADMVINGGDATTSSKEAFVNLVKVKTDLADKMLKAAELMTRLKMKNTYAYSGPHLNALQQNNYNIGSDNVDFNRKELIRAINNAKKKKEQ